MTKKDICLVTLVAVLGGWYVFHFTDWFRHKSIHIEYTVRVLPAPVSAYGRPANTTGKEVENVTFSFRKNYRLTSVKVVLAAEIQTNKYAHALWELVSLKGSQPVNGISYGIPIPGMAPSALTGDAEPLEPGVEYRLLVEARSLKGTNDFSVPARPATRRWR